MNTHSHNNYPRSVAEQTINNTTSWVGQAPGDHHDIIKGQTFVASTDGDLQAIEVVPNVISHSGKLKLTLYSFDERQHSWGPALGSATLEIKKPDTGKWIAFQIPGLHLNKGMTYGFRLESHDTFIGVGEMAGSSKNPPLTSGQEWRFTGNNQHGDAFTYLSLAFRVGLRA